MAMKLEKGVEREKSNRFKFRWRRFVIGAEALAVGAGIYFTFLGYYSEYQSITKAGGALLLIDLGDLVYSSIKK